METDPSSSPLEKGRALLDRVYRGFPCDPEGVSKAMVDLLEGLCELRREISGDMWHQFCKDVVPKHELTKLIHQDPFTLHSVEKPRGYAGDALLLDYIYGCRPVVATPLGKHIFAFTTNTPASRSVRERAKIIAAKIDRAAERRGPLRVLSIACGHLREAEMSQAMQRGDIAEYVAFDQDEDSLAHVDERFAGKGVTTIRGSIGELLMNKHKELRGFDFVYAAGLYDYLSQRLATRLTTWMFNATCPGGITLLTNFLPDIIGAGYMESFMEWDLVFRTPEELLDTAERIPSDQMAEKDIFVEGNDRVAFVELHKNRQATSSIETAHRVAAARHAESKRAEAIRHAIRM